MMVIRPIATTSKPCEILKYARIGQEIRKMFNVMDVEVVCLAIVARVGWCGKNTNTLKTLGIEITGFSSHLCRLPPKGTINMVRLFIDG